MRKETSLGMGKEETSLPGNGKGGFPGNGKGGFPGNVKGDFPGNGKGGFPGNGKGGFPGNGKGGFPGNGKGGFPGNGKGGFPGNGKGGFPGNGKGGFPGNGKGGFPGNGKGGFPGNGKGGFLGNGKGGFPGNGKGGFPGKGKGNFMAVCEIVENDIITSYKCISMDTLINVYGKESNQRQYRQLLNQIVNKYGNSLIFLNPEYQSSHLIINKECIENKPLSKTVNLSSDDMVKQAATILRASVENSIHRSTVLPWPPTVANLKQEDRKPPSLLTLFYKLLLGNSCDNATLVNSFSDDTVYAISNGTFLTLKHCSIGLGLHGTTGHNQSVDKLARLGHCITCDQVDSIESSLAELIQHFQPYLSSLSDQFASQECKVSIYLNHNFIV